MLELGPRWWIILLRGVAAASLGIATLAWPRMTVLAVVLVFGAYLLADGLFSVISWFFQGEGERRRFVPLLRSMFAILAGVFLLSWPGIGAVTILIIIGCWALFAGALELWAGLVLPLGRTARRFLVAAGVASSVFGIIVLSLPDKGALALALLFGLYLLIFGLFSITLGMLLRRMRRLL